MIFPKIAIIANILNTKSVIALCFNLLAICMKDLIRRIFIKNQFVKIRFYICHDTDSYKCVKCKNWR